MTNPPVETTTPVNFDPLESGRYQLQEVIGTGGMATVFRAWDERLQVTRAIKVLLPQLGRNTTLRRRFESEARTMARLYHPNIVGVHDVGVDGDRVYIIMELVAGGSLMDHVTAHGPMPIKMATGSLLALLHALKAAHSKGVIHRDIKPHNIMVDHEGVQKVGDFGIAHVMNEDMSMTKTGSVMGTWGYMAPEQRASARDVDVRSDIYSAAATWYTLLTNLLPTDLFAVDLDETIFDGIPDVAHEVMKGATRLKAEDRYADCDEMILAVKALLLTLPEDTDDYPVPGADLDEEALGLGRRGATIVPHSGSSELNPATNPAMTYAGGELSADLSDAYGGTDAGTLFDAEDGVENTATVNRKNRLFFVLGMALTLGGGAYWLILDSSEPQPGDALPDLTQEQLQDEELLAQLYATDVVGDPGTPAEAAKSEEASAAPVPSDGSSVTKELDAPLEAVVSPIEADLPEKEVIAEPPKEVVPVHITPPRPAAPAFMASVPVRGTDDLETLYLLSNSTGKRFSQPFNRIPGGEYTLYYRFSGEDGPVLKAAMIVDVAAGKTPRIRCNAGFGTCQVQN